MCAPWPVSIPPAASAWWAVLRQQDRPSDIGTVCKRQQERAARPAAVRVGAGEVELVASATDSDGRDMLSVRSTSPSRANSGSWLNDRIDVLPGEEELPARRDRQVPGAQPARLPRRWSRGTRIIDARGATRRRPDGHLRPSPNGDRTPTSACFALRGRLREAPWYSHLGLQGAARMVDRLLAARRQGIRRAHRGRPDKVCHRLGMAEIRVGTRAHQPT